MDKWQEVRVTVAREAQEAVANLLIELGSQGVAIDDSADYLATVDMFGEILPEVPQTDQVVVTAYYPDHMDLAGLQKIIADKLADLPSFGFSEGKAELESQLLDEEDWAENWKQYFSPTRISHDLTIVPSWTLYDPSPQEHLIRLDPGMAFGTGTHPTTKLSLYALEQVLRGGETVLDVGTGSGVLSIAASLLGAERIYAYDLDETAVNVAKANIALNPTATHIQVTTGDLLRDVNQTADVIVANILADILVHLIDDAYALLQDEGYLIMSGIITDKWELVYQQAIVAGFFLETKLTQGDWHTGVFKKTQDIAGSTGG